MSTLGARERRVAVCHEWATEFGGSEQVSRRIADALGVQDLYTFAADPTRARVMFPNQTVRSSRRGRSRFARRHWQWMLPFMPGAWARLDLDAYDLVVTSSHACTNAISVPRGTYHVSYCHTPMRYAWAWRREIRRLPVPLRPLWPFAAASLRRADRRWAQRVTLFIANSHNVARRIQRCYGRASVVIHPPIDTSYWTPDDSPKEGFFLVAGRLVAYKRPDIAVEAARLAGSRLVVAGDGPELASLRERAGPTVEFVIRPSGERLRDLYRRATALLLPGIEDFGMTVIEAQACGTPVIAFRAGGATETVAHGRTGHLYDDPSPAALAGVLKTFDPAAYSVSALRGHVARFDAQRFDRAIRTVAAAVRQVSVGVAATEEFAQRLQKDLDVERQ
jgi:glycosyltransferase involved in cell wall biosynthesis